MLRSLKELIGYAIEATDGEMGKVKDFYFDDLAWQVRYIVAATGSWFSGREILLSTACVLHPRWEDRMMPVELTKQQVEASPDVDLEKPVSRQKEEELHRHYGWSPYWDLTTGVPFTDGAAGMIAWPAYQPKESIEDEPSSDPHLRSSGEVLGYIIKARDGDIGALDDFILDDDHWLLRYAVVDTGKWFPGKHVLIALTWIQDIDWAKRAVFVDLSKDSIERSPKYDPSQPVNREYEGNLYDYHGRPKYWL